VLKKVTTPTPIFIAEVAAYPKTTRLG